MSKINDQGYLRAEQYRDASNLNARIRLHVEFSTNKYGWFRWVFDQFELFDQAHLLELGCGPGDLWLENMDRIPDGWQIILSDFSQGMLDQARKRLADQSHTFVFETIDAQSIPYGADQYDIVIANHFLYHVPDRSKAIAEIRRVLKAGGQLYATTVGANHMKELPDMIGRFDLEERDFFRNSDVPFTMENGVGQLETFFSEVQARRYPDELRVTDVHVLADYAFSGMRLGLEESRRAEFIQFLKDEMAAREGVIIIQKDSGIFLAR
jgi:SAM-dependent methyltransferase